MGRWLNKIKKTSEIIPTQLTKPSSVSCVSIIPNHIERKKELTNLIKKISENYGGDDEQFLSDYIDDILATTDIEKALTGLYDLAKYEPLINKK